MNEAANGRRRLHQSALGLVEDLSIATDSKVPVGYTSVPRIALTYLGAARFSVGPRDTVIDSNRALLLQAGYEFSDCQIGRDIGRASVLLSPSAETLEELCRSVGTTVAAAFNRLTRPATTTGRLLTHRLLNLARADCPESLLGDELMIRALRENIEPGGGSLPIAAPRIVDNVKIDKVKEILHATDGQPVRLATIAERVGYTPVYLTQAFHKVEGVPLYRYYARLRLSQALLELRDCDDITGLALDLGFSSHSHFTSAFKSVYGLTPSAFRGRVS